MLKPEIKYSQLTVREMWRMYDEHAAKIGRKPLYPREHDRVRMAAALATLLTFRAPPDPPKANRQSDRQIILEELCKVSHYECVTDGTRVELADRESFKARLLISCGFAYSIVLERIKARLPKSRVSGASLRVHAASARRGKPGYENTKLPDKRPHSSKGVSHDKR